MSAPALFELLPIERVYTGVGTHTHLGDELARHGVGRALLLTGKSLAATDLVATVQAAAGGRVAAVHAAVGAHNPTSTVEAAAAAFTAVRADGIVAFGGGSVIDCAKAILSAQRVRVPIVDLPTTLSAAEWAASFGQTDDSSKVKLGGRELSLAARAVFLDGGLCVATPPWLWAGTGMRAIDHAVETILAPNTHVYLDTLAEGALRLMHARLRESVAGDPEVRQACLHGAWMSHAGSYTIAWGLSHQMGRQLGPRFDIPHGHTSAILLPAVVELERAAKSEQEARVAACFGAPPGGAADALRQLVRDLGLPGRLRDAGIADRADVEALFAGNAAAGRVIELVW